MVKRYGRVAFVFMMVLFVLNGTVLENAVDAKEAPSAKASEQPAVSSPASSSPPSDKPSNVIENDLPPDDNKEILKYGQEIMQPPESSAEPEMRMNPGTAPGTAAPFSLGARKSIIDTGAEDDSLEQGTAKIDNQFPPLNGNANQNTLRSGANQNANPPVVLQGSVKGGLNQVQLQRLANHDLVLIIDQSGSMRTPDCPISGIGRTTGTLLNVLLGPAAGSSRWDWCRDQTMKLAQETRFVCTRGFTVLLFSARFVVFQHVTLNQIPQIFAQNAPQSDTNLTEPVTYILNDYIARRNMMQGNVKPLAIAIITDGRPNNENTLRNALVQATQYMRNPDEIKVTFFLIGNSALNGKVFINDLEQNLTRYGARYSIVRSVSFWNLEKVGLPQALADALE